MDFLRCSVSLDLDVFGKRFFDFFLDLFLSSEAYLPTCPSSDDLRQRSVFGSEALAHLV
jgi:hypothetical protein